MVSLFSIVVGQYPDSLNTIVVSPGRCNVCSQVVGQGSANIFRVVLS